MKSYAQSTNSLFIPEAHEHCLNCFIVECNYVECSLVECCYCLTKLHQCKNHDHLLICQKSPTKCINAFYGCSAIMRRDRIGSHLSQCPASAVFCNYYWYRKFVNASLQRDFKLLAKSLSAILTSESSPDLDVNLVLEDQNSWFKFLREKRLKLLRTCDNGQDSSDEEAESKAKYARDNPFSCCYLCRLEPGSQHLHVLGNMKAGFSEEKDQEPFKVKSLSSKFHEKRNLFVELDHFCLDESKRKESMKKYCLNMCARTFRRDQMSNHRLYHENVQSFVPGFIVQRCPMAESGCDFISSSLLPRAGIMKFNDFVGCIVNVTNPNVFATSENDLTAYMINVIPLLDKYLDGLSIVCLAATNTQVRRRIYRELSHRGIVEMTWKKSESNSTSSTSKWINSDNLFSFCAVQAPTEWIVEPSAQLSEHIRMCSYNVMKSFEGIEKVRLPFAGPENNQT